MSKVVTLTAVCLVVTAAGATAQTSPENLPNNPLQGTQTMEDDANDFTFTESQLDEDMDAVQTISMPTSSVDPYRSQVGFVWSAMRFKARAYDNMYSTTYLNGLSFNDLELGRYNYSLLGGLNDVSRRKEGVSGIETSTFGVVGVGGGENINLRASAVPRGQKATLTACNRNYKARALYTIGTGVMENGWALAASAAYRWADEGVIDGTFYNSFSYYLSAEKQTGAHAFSLVTFGAPTERGQQAAATEEAYWLANSHYYNPNWGYQNGKKRNARVVNDYEPVALFTYDYRPRHARERFTTTLGARYTSYSTTALGWTGDAYDPRPDYYKQMPSSIFNVYGSDNTPEWLADNPQASEQYTTLYDFWTASEANRQINWDRLYLVNRQSIAEGGEPLYYQERRHNDALVWALASTYQRALPMGNLSAGLSFNHTTGYHYKTMEDLLGGETFTDVDKYAVNDYGRNAIEAQSDLRHPNRQVHEGDRFGYDYNTYVILSRLWADYSVRRGKVAAHLAAHVENTEMSRYGKMQNGQGQIVLPDGTYYDNSYGSSGWASFLGGGVKAAVSYLPHAGHQLHLGGSVERRAPLVRNAFVAPRVHNNYVDGLTLENIYSAEAAYDFQYGALSGKLAAYYTRFTDGVEQTAFYNDANSTFTYLTMTGVRKQHYGLELALKYALNNHLSVFALGQLAEAEYTRNTAAQLSTEGMNAEDNAKVNQWINPITGEAMPLTVLAKGMHVGSTPLTAVTLGVKYNINYWFFEVSANYFDRVYVGFAPYRRLSNIVENYVFDDASAYMTTKAYQTETHPITTTEEKEAFRALLREEGGVAFDQYGNQVGAYAARQQKCKGGWLFNASVGKSIRFHNSHLLNLNLQLQNIGNNTDLRTGGYEQNRDDNYYTLSSDPKIGKQKTYLFSRNAKYYYANAFNFYFNVSYKF